MVTAWLVRFPVACRNVLPLPGASKMETSRGHVLDNLGSELVP